MEDKVHVRRYLHYHCPAFPNRGPPSASPAFSFQSEHIDTHIKFGKTNITEDKIHSFENCHFNIIINNVLVSIRRCQTAAHYGARQLLNGSLHQVFLNN